MTLTWLLTAWCSGQGRERHPLIVPHLNCRVKTTQAEKRVDLYGERLEKGAPLSCHEMLLMSRVLH
jgi:hypothetical protein